VQAHVSNIAVVWHVELVAVPSTIAERRGTAPKPKHRRPMKRIVARTEEKVAEEACVDSVIGSRQGVLPHVERHLQILLVIKVEVLQQVHGAGGREIDPETGRALSPAAGSDAGEELRGWIKGGDESGLVLLRGMPDEGRPLLLSQDGQHHLPNARGACADKGAPPLPSATDTHRARIRSSCSL